MPGFILVGGCGWYLIVELVPLPAVALDWLSKGGGSDGGASHYITTVLRNICVAHYGVFILRR